MARHSTPKVARAERSSACTRVGWLRRSGVGVRDGVQLAVEPDGECAAFEEIAAVAGADPEELAVAEVVGGRRGPAAGRGPHRCTVSFTGSSSSNPQAQASRLEALAFGAVGDLAHVESVEPGVDAARFVARSLHARIEIRRIGVAVARQPGRPGPRRPR